MKKWLIVTLFVIFYVVLILAFIRTMTPEDTWTCNDIDGEWEKHGSPSTPQPTGDCSLENIILEQSGSIIILIILVIFIMFWEMVWKLIALWKCGRNNQLGWFIVIAILNTAGFLPILYLIAFRKNNNTKVVN